LSTKFKESSYEQTEEIKKSSLDDDIEKISNELKTQLDVEDPVTETVPAPGYGLKNPVNF